MKQIEIDELRNKLNNEIKRRKRIKTLLNTKTVQEYLDITGTQKILLSINRRDVLKDVLKGYKVNKSNKIYVCVGANYLDCSITYQDTSYYTEQVEPNSKRAENRQYTDIETGESVFATKSKNDPYGRINIERFERDNTVLNPYNSKEGCNGYQEVRLEFFETALSKGNEVARKLVLSKYPRLK